jgi:DNA gyrase subunit B
MERDFGSEIDRIKAELGEIRRHMLRNFIPKVEPHTPPESSPELAQQSREPLNDLLAKLVKFAEEQGENGAIAYTGTFSTGQGEAVMQSVWSSVVPTERLLHLNDNQMVERVLSSVGNQQRLKILLALLKQPMTVNQLMAVLGSNTTGQVYHHLKPLVAADIIKEERGVYAVKPHRVQGILMLLAGVWDLTDTRYTAGTWEEADAGG